MVEDGGGELEAATGEMRGVGVGDRGGAARWSDKGMRREIQRRRGGCG